MDLVTPASRERPPRGVSPLAECYRGRIKAFFFPVRKRMSDARPAEENRTTLLTHKRNAFPGHANRRVLGRRWIGSLPLSREGVAARAA